MDIFYSFQKWYYLLFRTERNSYEITKVAVQNCNRMTFGAINEGLDDLTLKFGLLDKHGDFCLHFRTYIVYYVWFKNYKLCSFDYRISRVVAW